MRVQGAWDVPGSRVSDPPFGGHVPPATMWAATLAVAAAAGVLAAAAPLALLALGGAALGTFVFVKWPRLALAAILLLSAAMAGGEFRPLGTTDVAGLIGLGAAAGGGLALLITRWSLGPRVFWLPFTVFLALAAGSLTYTPALAEGRWVFFTLAGFLALFGVAYSATRGPRDLRLILWLVLAGAAVPLAVGFLQLATGDLSENQGFDTVRATFSFSNGYGFYLSILVVLAVVVLLETRRPALKLVAGTAVIACAASLFLTYSRSAWLSVIAALILLALFQYPRLAVGVALVGIVAAMALPAVAELARDRFADLSSSSIGYSTGSAKWREHMWREMSPYAQEHAVRGHGLGAFGPLTFREFGGGAHGFAENVDPKTGVAAHNDYLRLAVELGYPGAALWVVALLGLAFAMYRARRAPAVTPYATAMAILVLAIVAQSAVSNVLSNPAVLYYVAIAAGAVAGAARSTATRAQLQA